VNDYIYFFFHQWGIRSKSDMLQWFNKWETKKRKGVGRFSIESEISMAETEEGVAGGWLHTAWLKQIAGDGNPSLLFSSLLFCLYRIEKLGHGKCWCYEYTGWLQHVDSFSPSFDIILFPSGGRVSSSNQILMIEAHTGKKNLVFVSNSLRGVSKSGGC
jgi:hypothetical protein